MADKEKYIIKVEGKLVEVSPEVYYAYFRMERQERWQEEKSNEMPSCPMMRWMMEKELEWKLYRI